MVQPTNEQLAAEIAKLKAANAELTRSLAFEQGSAKAHTNARAFGKGPRSRFWGWTLLSTTFIVIGALLAPVAVVAAWAHRELTDTTSFVATFAPLADDPAVQDFVALEVVDAIESQLQIDQVADDLFTELDGLDIAPRGKDALALLQAPAVSGVKSLIKSTVTEFVQSDTFATIWKDALTITHQQLVSTATGQPDAAIVIDANQQLSVELGPIIQAVKEALVADGITLADRIPEISRSIVIAENSSIGIYLTIYQIVVALGVWLPWAMLLLLSAGVIMARRRAIALAWAAGAVLASMLAIGSGIDIGQNVFAVAVAASVPHDAAVVLYAGILGDVIDMITALGVLAGTVLMLTLLLGPWPSARRLRLLGTRAISSLRGAADRHGISTSAFGTWLHRWRKPLRLVVGALAAAIVLFNRPLTPAMIAWTAVVGIGALILLELLSRPPVEHTPEPQPAEPNKLKETLP